MSLMARLDSSVLNEFLINSRKSVNSIKEEGNSFQYALKDYIQLIFLFIVLVGFILQRLFQENVHFLCFFLC